MKPFNHLIGYHIIDIMDIWIFLKRINSIGGVIASVLASSAVDRGFDPRSGQTKNYKVDICCFSVKHTALRKKSRQ
jgi:hypothetical protein